jgi:methionyl-tRNA formyltransferase
MRIIDDCGAPAKLNLAYLNLKGHPRGLLMLHQLLSAGFRPSLVIDEDSELAVQGRQSQLKALQEHAKEALALLQAEQYCLQHGLRYASVEDHNNDHCRQLLAELSPDWIILGDTRILRPSIFGLARRHTINTHPGYLPVVRGNHPYIWAIVDGLPQGASVHIVNQGVDTGPLLDSKVYKLVPGTSFSTLVRDLNVLCSELLCACMQALVGRGLQAREQAMSERPTYRAAPASVRMDAIRALEGAP